MPTIDSQLSFSIPEAAAASGHTIETIRAAIRSGDLRAQHVEIAGRKLRKRHIMRDDLLAWLRGEVR